MKLKNVRQVYTSHRVYTQFEDQEPMLGKVVLSNNIVMILRALAEAVSQPLELLTSASRPVAVRRAFGNWSGKATVGVTLQSGKQTARSTISTTAELARRTPNTTLLLNYLAQLQPGQQYRERQQRSRQPVL